MNGKQKFWLCVGIAAFAVTLLAIPTSHPGYGITSEYSQPIWAASGKIRMDVLHIEWTAIAVIAGAFILLSKTRATTAGEFQIEPAPSRPQRNRMPWTIGVLILSILILAAAGILVANNPHYVYIHDAVPSPTPEVDPYAKFVPPPPSSIEPIPSATPFDPDAFIKSHPSGNPFDQFDNQGNGQIPVKRAVAVKSTSEPNPFLQDVFITIGSTKKQVLEIMGSPDSIQDWHSVKMENFKPVTYVTQTDWYYNWSRVSFRNGVVSEWNDANHNLKTKLTPDSVSQ